MSTCTNTPYSILLMDSVLPHMKVNSSWYIIQSIMPSKTSGQCLGNSVAIQNYVDYQCNTMAFECPLKTALVLCAVDWVVCMISNAILKTIVVCGTYNRSRNFLRQLNRPFKWHQLSLYSIIWCVMRHCYEDS